MVQLHTMRSNEGETPAGYTVKVLSGIGATVPMPNKWFFETQAVDGTIAFFMTEENKKRRGCYETGLAVQAFTDGAARLEITPEAFVLGIGEQIPLDDNTQLISVSKIERSGNLVSMRRTVATTDNNEYVKVPVVGSPGDVDLIRVKRMHQIVQATGNRETGMLYLTTFETPSVKWEKNGKIGEYMLNNLKFRQSR